ncbi:uncharacterized protein LOC131300701 isoform X2 [Rhododendron vialii]|uniref:uncharacterized protein LOC131300701 isoform X2 n=1 Tax=Rhododendron vialii TaxID=182163 RepID=UPI00265F1C83|nr:uncharacterized protein LOC131300701 isoform X2 [Rhododendron vialii]
MTPAKPLTDIDRDSNMHSSPKVAAHIVNRILLAKSSGKDTMGISNSLDAIIKVEDPCDEQITAQADASDIKIAEDPEATDYSSSFDGTVSGTENCAEMSDVEVESCFGGDNGFPFDGFSSVFPMRKKKLTTHWRRFVRPLMWRCKWTELKIKQFQSQASKYSTELAAYDQKQLELDHLTSENFASKPLPFTVQSHGNKTMKRRKRKRVEDTTDVTLYMSQHKLFSYNENNTSDPDSTFVAEEFSNPVFAEKNNTSRDEGGTCNDSSFYESKDGNESLEEILHRIETVHSRVHKLKSQLVVVIGENGMKLSSSENLSLLVPCDGQNSSAHSPTFSACNGDTTSLGALNIPNQNLSEYDIGDFMLPESMFSSYGEGIFVPDIIESTVSVLSSADVTIHQSQIGDSCEDIMDNVIHYQQAELEIKQTTEKHREPEGSGQEESSDPSPFPASEPDLPPITSTLNEQSRLTSCLGSEIHFPKSKRKRGERKAGSGNWSR